MSTSILQRVIHPEVRIIDQAKGVVDFVASDESIDCYREIIRAAGWRFSMFHKNAPFVDSHDYSTVKNQIGAVIDFSVQGKQLINRVRVARDVPENTLAQLAWGMIEKGYLKACSVGFWPVKYLTRYDSDPKPFADQLEELGLNEDDRKRVQCVYIQQEQVELSACVLGANPNALVKAFRGGAVTEEQLSKVGFDTDEKLRFLHISADEYEAASPALRMMIDARLADLLGRNSISQTQTSNPSFPPGRAAAEETQRREREALIRDLQRLGLTA